MAKNPIQEAFEIAGEEKEQAVSFAWKMRELINIDSTDDEHYIRLQGAINKLVEEAEIVKNEIGLIEENRGVLVAA